MALMLKLISALWKIGAAVGVFWFTAPQFGIYPPHIALVLPAFLAVLVFFDPGLWQGIAQFMGNEYAAIAHKKNTPCADTYECKAGYILPFEGKWTVVNGGAAKGVSHSWDVVSQRYAYDFIVVDDQGKSSSGDKSKLESYFCYGRNILAPADGTVVKVKKGHRDSRVDGEKVYNDTWYIGGNSIVIQHAENEYSELCHLMPGSIAVKPGDKVKQGDVIAKCGNSGNSSEPHLHFQLQTGKSFFASMGLPVSFANIGWQEKANYSLLDPRSPQKEPLPAKGGGQFIGRGMEVWNLVDE